MIKSILQGMVVGIANIIPGVSGGTMMVAMGLYDKLIHSITHIKSELKESLKLLFPIFLGAGLAIVILSRSIRSTSNSNKFCLLWFNCRKPAFHTKESKRIQSYKSFQYDSFDHILRNRCINGSNGRS